MPRTTDLPQVPGVSAPEPEPIPAQKTSEHRELLSRMKNKVAEQAYRDFARAVAEYRSKIMADQMAADQDALAELQKKAIVRDQQGREVNLWDLVLNKAREAIHSEQHAYNDWRSAMMSLLVMFGDLSKAIRNSRQQMTAPLMSALRNNVLTPMKNRILDKLRGDPRIDIPTLIHDVSCNDNGELVYGPITRADTGGRICDSIDGREIPSEVVEDDFKKVVDLWLLSRGYVPIELLDAQGNKYSPEQFKFVDHERNGLTPAKFDELKNDRLHGLAQFLETEPQLSFAPKL